MKPNRGLLEAKERIKIFYDVIWMRCHPVGTGSWIFFFPDQKIVATINEPVSCEVLVRVIDACRCAPSVPVGIRCKVPLRDSWWPGSFPLVNNSPVHLRLTFPLLNS